MAFLGTKIQTTTFTWFSSLLHRDKHKLLLHRKSLKKTMMTTTQCKSKRPICPSCSKPTRTCLCSRILTPRIPNSVNVTILQHALECNHPLNSARIARLGLKNLTLATVSDVHDEARFLIQLLNPNPKSNSVGNSSNGLFSCEIGVTHDLFPQKDSNFIDSPGFRNDVGDVPNSHVPAENVNLISSNEGVDVNDDVEKNSVYTNCDLASGVGVNADNGYGGSDIAVTIGKFGAISSLSHVWMAAECECESSSLGFDKILTCPEACEALSKGFLVKKLSEDVNLEECEEFELEICPGSVLLFPSDKAVTVSDLVDVGFEVKNLIVLDGTWSKAKRIYCENPWLNILPHLKLEVNEASLYSEVRRQPKAGYLSTIESIVFALKAVGESHEGLDNLLDTFESMVGDQRRCKDDRMSKLSPS